MSSTKNIYVDHYDKIDTQSIDFKFIQNQFFRAYLRIPLRQENREKVLCIIGQNPSHANQTICDRTVRYLEELIYLKTTYTKIIILNLYPRVDTKKIHDDVDNSECEIHFKTFIQNESDFLLVFGQPKTKKNYKFIERSKKVVSQLQNGNKNLYKLELGTSYPPHPGNRLISYKKFLKIVKFDADRFLDEF